jgi:hypothetical protein
VISPGGFTSLVVRVRAGLSGREKLDLKPRHRPTGQPDIRLAHTRSFLRTLTVFMDQVVGVSPLPFESPVFKLISFQLSQTSDLHVSAGQSVTT